MVAVIEWFAADFGVFETLWFPANQKTISTNVTIVAQLPSNPRRYPDGAELAEEGWRYDDRFKGFFPSDDIWSFHGRHGSRYATGGETNSLFIGSKKLTFRPTWEEPAPSAVHAPLSGNQAGILRVP